MTLYLKLQLYIANNCLLTVIDLLKANPAAMPFTEFEKAADYDKVIKYPMCLNEIRDRINRHQCDSREIVRIK